MSNLRMFCIAFVAAVAIGCFIANHFAATDARIQSPECMTLWGLFWASLVVAVTGDRHYLTTGAAHYE